MSHGAGIYAPDARPHERRAASLPEIGRLRRRRGADLSENLGPTSMFMAPTMVRRLTDRAKATGRRGDGIKTIVYGGGPMYRADIEEAVDRFGPKFVQIYGQGECPMAISALSRRISPIAAIRSGASGLPRWDGRNRSSKSASATRTEGPAGRCKRARSWSRACP
jgi:acyl-CoA synthetase (AMP-forming)/AMP-acid ligase II